MGDAPIDCVFESLVRCSPRDGAQLKEVGPWGWTLKFVDPTPFSLCALLPDVTICGKLLLPCLSQCNGLCALKLCQSPLLLSRFLLGTVLESSHVGRVTIRVEGE